jgi:hypothetical protein
MLHIHGGDEVLERLRRAGIAGERLNWREVLCDGPTPRCDSRREWRRIRSEFLSRVYQAEPDGSDLLVEQEEALARALAEQDEIVLWFSSDWFCQAILFSLLGLLHQKPRRRARLSLVAPVGWPNVPENSGCTLAFVPEAELSGLLARRKELTPSLLHLGSTVWDAMCAGDPREVAALAARDLPDPSFPSLREGLRIHLCELPSATNGLAFSEERALAALSDSLQELNATYHAFQRVESRPWITDMMFATRLRGLNGVASPLVEWSAHGQNVRRTALGGEVLAGRRDWCTLTQMNRWVGGVHLTPDNLWRIDRESLALSR